MNDDENDENEQQYSNNNSSTGGGILGLIVIIALCWWGYSHFIKKNYTKPWFTGRSIVHVCKPYVPSIADCYILTAESDGNAIYRINFNNGGYIYNHGGNCFEAYPDPLFNKEKRVCYFIENDGTKYSVQP